MILPIASDYAQARILVMPNKNLTFSQKIFF
jgi:hypothetical protein